MLQSSQTIVRVTALALAILLFVGIWSNDQPEYYLALRTAPGETLIARQPAQPSVSPRHSTLRLDFAVGPVAKSLMLETDGLTIAPERLNRHLAQLPLGIAVGDYRIVDDRGGVGWLRVRTQGVLVAGGEADRVITTQVESQSVRFIHVAPPAVSGRDEITIR